MMLMPGHEYAIRVSDLRALLARFPADGVVVVNHVGNLAVLDNPDDQGMLGFIELASEEATVYAEEDAGAARGPGS